MSNKKPFSIHYLSSKRLRQINFSIRDFALFFVFLLIISVGINYYLSINFSTDYYKNKIEQAEQEYSDVSQELLDKINKMERELALLEEKDSEMRTYAALPPLDEDIKVMGTGGSEEELNEDDSSTILDKLRNTIDSLSYTLDAQKNSYDIIFNKIKSNETMYRHIPSIMPVESAYLGSQVWI
jgi:hypothetical protein